MQARYHVEVPTADQLGQPLHSQLPKAAHQWLSNSRPRLFKSVWISGPHHHGYGTAHHIEAIAEESPETDSLVKQLAAHVGQFSNFPIIGASKTGKNGIESWVVANKHHVPGLGADPNSLAQPVVPSSSF